MMFDELMNKFQSVIDNNDENYRSMSQQISALIKSNQSEIDRQDQLRREFDQLKDQCNQGSLDLS